MDKELLEAIGQLLDTKLDEKLAPMQADIAQLKEGQDELKADMRAVKVKLEVDIPKQFGLLTDGHKGLVEKFAEIDRMADSLDEMKGSMVALETYILQNRSSIIELQKAKG